MVGLGPRVGSAYVDVNLNWDGDVRSVGKRIQRQLDKIADRNGKVYRRMGSDAVLAWRTALGTIVASAPHMGSAISSVAASATMLGGALNAVGQSSAAMLPIFTSLGLAGFTASIGMRNFGAAVSEVDPEKLKLLLSDMPKSMQEAVMSTRAMSKEMRAVIWEKLFVGIGPLMARLRETGVIQQGLGKMAVSLNEMARGVLRYAGSAQGVGVLNKFFENNAQVFSRLSQAVVPFLDGFLRLVNALTPAALRLADRITDIAERFQAWTKAEGFAKRMDDTMKGAEKTAGLLFKVIGNLGGALGGIFRALAPATNAFLQILVDVTQKFEDWSKSVSGQKTIEEWGFRAVDVMTQFGRTIRAVFDVLSRLSSSEALITFLHTVQRAFELIGKLPLEKIVAGFVKLAQALEPISAPILAMIIAFSTFQILLGNVLAQVAGVIGFFLRLKALSVLMGGAAGSTAKLNAAVTAVSPKLGLLARLWQGLMNIFSRVGGVVSRVIGFFTKTSTATAQVATSASKVSGAFRPVLSILGRFAKFAGFAGIAIWLGTIIAGSEKLKGKFGELFSAMGGVFSSLKGAFSEIWTALQPLFAGLKTAGSAMAPVMGVFDKIAEFIMGLALDALIYGFQSLANVVKGIGKIFAGLITVLTGIFTLDFSKVWDGLKKMASGVGPLLKGLFGVFITFFAPARFLKLAGGAIKGLLGGLGKGIGKGIGALVGVIGKHLGKLGGAFKSFLSPLAPIGKFFQTLFGGIIKAAKWLWNVLFGNSIFPDIQNAFSAFVNAIKGYINLWISAFQFVVGIFQTIGAAIMALFQRMWVGLGVIFNAILLVVTTVWTAIITAISTAAQFIWTVVTTIFNAIRNTIATILSAVWAVISTVWNSILSTIQTVLNTIWTFVQWVWGRISNSISKAINLVKSIISSVMNTVQSIWSGAWNKLKSTAESVWGKITNFFSGAKAKMKSIFDGIGGAIKNALKSAFNGVSSIWNSTVGKLSFTAPDWIPMFGGKGWSMPKMPTYAMGTNFHPGGAALVGERGPEIVDLPRGSRVHTASQSRRMLNGDGSTTITYGNINVTISVDDLDKMHKITDFLAMLDQARVDSRRTLRSGTVTA